MNQLCRAAGDADLTRRVERQLWTRGCTSIDDFAASSDSTINAVAFVFTFFGLLLFELLEFVFFLLDDAFSSSFFSSSSSSSFPFPLSSFSVSLVDDAEDVDINSSTCAFSVVFPCIKSKYEKSRPNSNSNTFSTQSKNCAFVIVDGRFLTTNFDRLSFCC